MSVPFIIRHQVISAVSGSKDLQMVQIAIRVLFKPDPKELAFIYRRLGKGISFVFATRHDHHWTVALSPRD